MNTAMITEGTYPSGQPYWMVQAFVAGKRIRRYFTDEQKARAEKERIDKGSAELLDVPEKIIHEAWDCHKRLTQRGWTLTRATDWVLGHAADYDSQPPLQKLIEQFLAEQKASGVAPATLIDLRSRLRKLSRWFSDSKAHEITSDEIRQWNTDLEEVEELGALSRRHYLNKASQFFRRCVLNKKCAENPVAAVKRPKVIEGEIEFLTVEQCQRILDLAADHGLYHYAVLGMFAGIRAAELRRLHRKHVHLDRRIIILGADVTKKSRRRVIEMHEGDPLGDCLMSWLSARPLPDRIFAGNLSTYRRHFRRLRDRLGFDWVQNGLRHTAATYCYGLTSDIIKTAALLGDHDIRTLDMHYRGLTTRKEAEAFYALRPADSEGNATAILRRLETTPL
jgi:integrase